MSHLIRREPNPDGDGPRRPALEALALWLEREAHHREGLSQALFLRAAFHPVFRHLGGLSLRCQQTFRPDHDALAAAGLPVALEAEGEFDLCLYLGTRHRSENLANFGRGMALLRPGGLFVCSLANDAGAARFERLLGERAPLEFTFSKHHSRVFGARRGDPEAFADWREEGAMRRSERTGLYTCPGIFGWDKVDEGSRLLADTLPARMPGVGADVGCGHGYLSRRILQERRDVRGLHLFEAEHLALDAARRNLEDVRGDVAVSFHWADVTAGLPEGAFDWVVMNAPFHEGRASRPALGVRFLESAVRALRPGGVLHLVANRHLPYEIEVDSLFARSERVAEEKGFKVIRAWR